MASNSETLTFQVDENIIYSLIKSQAGTVSKAFLELVMNSIDAGAKKVVITFDKHSFKIVDDGKGFSSEFEIHNYFKTFGTPHEEGDAIYGKFRMGRGQIMAFATNVWRTNTFLMDVDFKNRGRKFLFRKNLKEVKGVEIKGNFYEPLSGQEYNEIIYELKEYLKYSQIETIVNGNKLNHDLENSRWTLNTDEAYIKIKKSDNFYDTLSVYNLGVLVCRYPAHKFGFSGTIVSKLQLDVNFARNDILVKQCPVWKKISKDIKKISLDNSKKKIEKFKNLSLSEIIYLTKSMLDISEDWDTIKKYPVFINVLGKYFTFEQLLKNHVVTISPNNFVIDEKIHRDKLGFVLSNQLFSSFDVSSISELKDKLYKMLINYNQHSLAAKLNDIHFLAEG